MYSDVLNLSLLEILDKINKKEFSAEEYTNVALKKAQSLENLNAFITICDNTNTTLRNNSVLKGLPFGIKDNILTKNVRTTCGSKMLSNFNAPYDATVIKKLKNHGGIVFGKTNMDEFAMGSSNETSFFGPVKNPYNPERVPGGSSGGSAVAVAANILPAAFGTDTGGSIRQPASFCGVVGIKPTYGRISRYGVIAYASSLDQVGIFTRNIKDCAFLLNLVSGYDEYDSTSLKVEVPDYLNLINDSLVDSKSIKPLRVGIPKEYFIEGVNKEIRESIENVIKSLTNLGIEPVEISLPHTEAAVATYYVIAPAEASSNLARYDGVKFGHRSAEAKNLNEVYRYSRSEGFGKEVKRRIAIGTYVLSSGYYDAYYLKAQKVRTLISQDFENAFNNHCDFIIAPSSPSTAFKIGEKIDDTLEMYLNDIFTIPVNLAGLPAVSVPCGFDSNKLPIGFQLIGKRWDESTILKVANHYEMNNASI